MASKKVSKKSDFKDVEMAILQWFESEGEPATVQSLTDALGSKFSKSLVQNTLEQCLSENKLQIKDIKKARFYFLASQEGTNENENHSSMDSEKVNIVQKLHLQTKSISDLSNELNLLMQKPSSIDRASTIQTLYKECETIKKSLRDLKDETKNKRNHISDNDISLLIRRYNRTRELWRERKRMTERIIDAIFGESCDAKELSDTFGLTTDQQVNISFTETNMTLPLIRNELSN